MMNHTSIEVIVLDKAFMRFLSDYLGHNTILLTL